VASHALENKRSVNAARGDLCSPLYGQSAAQGGKKGHRANLGGNKASKKRGYRLTLKPVFCFHEPKPTRNQSREKKKTRTANNPKAKNFVIKAT